MHIRKATLLQRNVIKSCCCYRWRIVRSCHLRKFVYICFCWDFGCWHSFFSFYSFFFFGVQFPILTANSRCFVLSLFIFTLIILVVVGIVIVVVLTQCEKCRLDIGKCCLKNNKIVLHKWHIWLTTLSHPQNASMVAWKSINNSKYCVETYIYCMYI